MGPTDEAVRAELRRIILSPGFVHSDRMRRFLTYCVEETLAGRPQNLKEYAIGVEAFDRPKHYAPAEDPIVRVEARRLRRKLEEYYAGAGSANAVRIELPKGSYVPVFFERPVVVAPTPSRRWPKALAAIGGMAIAVALLYPLMKRRPPIAAPALPALTRLTNDSGLTTDPSISADGSWLAYASDRAAGAQSTLDVWLQKLPTGDPVRLTHGTADNHQPALSPKADQLAYRAEGDTPGVYLLSVGAPSEALKLIAREGRDPQWAPDGTRIAYWVGSTGDERLAPAGRILVATPGIAQHQPVQPQFVSAACPAWSPDGRRLLFIGVVNAGATPDWWTAPVSSAEPASATGLAAELARNGLSLPFRECSASWRQSGIVFAARSGDVQNLWRMPLDSAGKPAGVIERLTFGTASEWRPTSAGDRIIFSSRTSSSHLSALHLADARLEEIVTSAPDASFPSASKDGQAVAFLSSGRLWWKSLRDGREQVLTQPPVQPRNPQISADGSQIAFTDSSVSPTKAYLVSPRTSQPETLPITAARIWDWTGSLLLFQRDQSRHQVEELDVRTGRIRTLLSSPFDIAGPRLSPDARSVAWHVIPSAVRRQLFYAAYADPAKTAARLIDEDAMDRNCSWSADSREIYFLSERDGFRCIWKAAPGSAKPPRPVRHFHSARQSLGSFGDVASIGLSATPDRLIFAIGETASNVWMLSAEVSKR